MRDDQLPSELAADQDRNEYLNLISEAVILTQQAMKLAMSNRAKKQADRLIEATLLLMQVQGEGDWR